MKGEVLKKKKPAKKTASHRGSLYSRLILRNMLNDKARVAVTIAIIAASTFLVGTGVSMKFAFDRMPDKQISEVNRYDLKVTMSDTVSDETAGEIEAAIGQSGASYIPATSETRLYR
jgi:hypothetical protein